MRKIFLSVSFILISFVSLGQNISVWKKKELLEALTPKDDKIYVLNFWATWCSPCVKELHVFREIEKRYKVSELEVILVSLDFIEDLSQAQKLLTKKKITFKTYLLDETKYDSWIDGVEPTWQGAIPITVILKNKKRIFMEGETTLEQLNQKIKEIKEN